MPKIEVKGLSGLKGIGVDSPEFSNWYQRYKDKLANRNWSDVKRIWTNSLIADNFGENALYSLPNNNREEFLKSGLANKALIETYTKPLVVKRNWKDKDGNILKTTYEHTRTANGMSMNQLNKLLQADYQAKEDILNNPLNDIDASIREAEKNEKDRKDIHENRQSFIDKNHSLNSASNQALGQLAAVDAFDKLFINALNAGIDASKIKSLQEENDEAVNKVLYDYNKRRVEQQGGSKLIDEILNNKYSNMSEEKVNNRVIQSINSEDFRNDWMKGYWRDGSSAQKYEIKGYDTKKYLATIDALQQLGWDNEEIRQYLENDTHQYVSDSRWFIDNLWTRGKDIGIHALSYTTSKWAEPIAGAVHSGGMHEVYMDKEGNVVGNSDVKIINGNAYDSNGNKLRKEKLSGSTLYNMGKDNNGEDLFFAWNPQFWKKAEQNNTLWDNDEVEKWGGVSPYATVYDVGDSESWWGMGTIRMSSFIISDVAEMALLTAATGGVGVYAKAASMGRTVQVLGRALDATSTLAKVTKAGKTAEQALRAGKVLKAAKESGRVLAYIAQETAPIRGAVGIGNQYGNQNFEDAYNEFAQTNDRANFALAQQNVQDKIQSNPDAYNKAIQDKFNKLKQEDRERLKDSNGDSSVQKYPKNDKLLREQAEEMVLHDWTTIEYDNITNSDKNIDRLAQARENAQDAFYASMISEGIKYAIINKVGYRSWLYNTSKELANKEANNLVNQLTSKITNGIRQFELQPFNSAKQLGKAGWSQWFGGFHSNATDEWQSGMSIGYARSLYNNYLADQENGQALLKDNASDFLVGQSMLEGAMYGLGERFKKESTIEAGLSGGFGSFMPNFGGVVGNMIEAKKSNKSFSDYIKEKGLGSKKLGLADFLLSNGITSEYKTAKASNADLNASIKLFNDAVESGIVKDLSTFRDILTGNYEVSTMMDAKDMQVLGVINAIKAQQEILNGKNVSIFDKIAKRYVIEEGLPDLLEAVENDSFTDSQKSELINNYFSNNPHIARTEETEAEAWEHITNNLQEFKQVSQDIDEYTQKIQTNSRENGTNITPTVAKELASYYALAQNTKRRIARMREENGITNEGFFETDDIDIFLSSFGDSYTSLEDHKKVLREHTEYLKREQESLQKELTSAIDDLNTLNDKKDAVRTPEEDKVYQGDVNRATLKVKHLQLALDRLVSDRQALEEKISDLGNYFTEDRGPIKMEDILGKVDFSNQESIDKAVKKLLEFNPHTVARLLFNIENEIRERSIPNSKKRKYSDDNFTYLKGLYDYIKRSNPQLLTAIKDIAHLEDRVRGIEKEIVLGLEHPDVAEYRFDMYRRAEADHAKALQNQLELDIAITAFEAEIEKANLDSIKNRDRSKKFKKVYNNIFKELKQFRVQYLNKLLANTKNPILRDIINKVIEYKTTLDDITNAVLSYYPTITDSTLDAFINTLENTLDSDIPTRDDLIHALLTINDNVDRPFEVETGDRIVTVILPFRIYKKLKELDTLRNSSVIESAEQAAKRRTKRNEWNRNQKAREGAQRARLEEEERKKAEEAKKKEDETKTSVKEEFEFTDEDLAEDTETPEEESKKGEDKTESVEDKKESNTGDSSKGTPPIKESPLSEHEEFGTGTEDLENMLDVDKADVNSKSEGALPPVKTTSDETLTTPDEEQRSNESGIILGNTMRELDTDNLQANRIASPLTPKSKGDRLSNFQSWLHRQDIKLSNIIDFELGRIFKNNPDIEVKLLRAHPSQHNEVKKEIFTVIEYTADVAKYHNNDNGGVITAQDGKQYLIIGTIGYEGANSAMQDSVHRIFNDIAEKAHIEYNKNNANVFYVDPTYSTKIQSVKEGYMVKQSLKDTEITERSIMDLLLDPDRNPYGLKLQNLVWGIQRRNAVVDTVNMADREFYTVRDEEKNLGNAYLYIPSATGVMIPARVRVATLNSIKEGSKLKENIDKLLRELWDSDYNTRVEKIKALDKLLYLTTEVSERNNITTTTGEMLWIGKEGRNTLTLQKDGIVVGSFEIGKDDPEAFVSAMYELNPRIQITTGSLSNITSLQTLMDAGALNVDIAMLATQGVNYNICDMDASGKAITQVGSTKPIISNIPTKSIKTVLYNGNTYRLIDGVWKDSSDNPIQTSGNESLFNQLRLNRIIADRNSKPERTAGGYDYFILDSNPDNPSVVKRSRSTNHVVESSKETALKFIDIVNKENAKNNRETNIKEHLKEDNIDIIGSEGTEGTKGSNADISSSAKPSSSSPSGIESARTKTKAELEAERLGKGKESNISFNNAITGKRSDDIFTALDEVFGDKLPDNTKETIDFLKNKGVEVDNIENIDSWIEQLHCFK